MESILLTKDAGKYQGKYVALRSFADKDVMSAGDDPVQVRADAQRKGAERPVIVYIPAHGMASVY